MSQDRYHSSRAASSALNAIIALSGIVGLFVILGLNPTREEEEFLGISLGGITLLVGAVGLGFSIRDCRRPLNAGFPVLTRLKPIFIAFVALIVGGFLVFLGWRAAVSGHMKIKSLGDRSRRSGDHQSGVEG
jgi:hypothetical protein